MQLLLVKILGYVLARVPLCVGEGLCKALGSSLYHLWGSKRRLVLSNLHHAFPLRDRKWLIETAKLSFQRTIEMGYLGAIGPFLSDQTIRDRYQLDDSFHKLTDRYNKDPFPALVLTMHFSQLESSSFLPVLREDIPPTGVIFRPMNQKKIEAWVREVRSRGKFHLMPRREGFLRSKELLHSGQVVALFFDQNAGASGSLDLFMDRISSNSELPDILSKVPNTESFILYTQRTSFCSGRISVFPLVKEDDDESIQQLAHQWLEDRLKHDEQACQDWLWLHKRWKTQTDPRKRFRIEQRRSQLPAGNIPRTFRLWVRLPECLDRLAIILPYLEILYHSRPDLELTLCGFANLQVKMSDLVVPWRWRELPMDKGQRRAFWREVEWEYPDVVLVFDEEKDIHFEIAESQAPQRFGWIMKGQKKKPLTSVYVEKGTSVRYEKTVEKMLEHFGLETLKSRSTDQ